MAPQIVEFDRIALIPLSVTSLCSCRSQSEFCHRPAFPNLPREVSGSGVFRFRKGGVLIEHRRRVISGAARAEQPERIDDNEITDEEVKTGNPLSAGGSIDAEHQQKTSQLRKRIIFGIGIGVPAGGVVLAGGWVFTVALAAAVFIGSREYFELVRSHGIASGMTPPPRYLSRACSVVCCLMPLLTLILLLKWYMFSKESGNHVEECKLRVSYVPPPQPPSPVREGSEEGSSPRATVSDNGTVNQTSDFNTISKGLLDQQESSTEVKALISRLTEEKRSAIQQNNKLQQELELLRRRSRGGGIPFMYVIIVGLIGLMLGYLLKRT
ncbi:hypothetical protein ACS0TY_020072 [Phlomoides rotata]